MDPATLARHKRINALQSLSLAAGMGALVAAVAYIIGGSGYALLALALIALLYLFNPAISPALVLRMYRGHALSYAEAAPLYETLRLLSARAELKAVPVLYYLPTPVMNAFAVGQPGNAAIALSDGLLRSMGPRELAGILAHEVSHIAHNDLRTMSFADLASRLTLYLSLFGVALLLLNLPLILWTEHHVSWLAILLLVTAPGLSTLLQFGLSRSREYHADLSAARLLGDPIALASALEKMERFQGGFLEQMLFPNRPESEPSLLRTHPPTQERVRRLLALQKRRDWNPLPAMRAYQPPWQRPSTPTSPWRWF